MRFIDNSNLAVADDWFQKAVAVLDEARIKPTREERIAYINSKANLWSELKPKLEQLSNLKCWYCESHEKRSDRAVEHYRPKGNVRDSDPPHEGYWWLAFDPTNFRLACTFCNERRKDRSGNGEVGGKADYFPIIDEVNRVQPEGSDFTREFPVLLDPCIASDVSLLWYADDGRVVPYYDEQTKALAYLRADKSIHYYHLNERDIKDERQALYNKIKGKIEDGDFQFEDSFNGNRNADYALESIMKELAQLRHKNSEFSAFAKAIIAGFRSPRRPWLDRIDLLES